MSEAMDAPDASSETHSGPPEPEEPAVGFPATREDLIERARSLYARGLSKTEAGQVLGVTSRTVRRWQQEDLRRDVSWDKERELEHGHRPERVLKLLERRFSRMVLECEQGDAAESQSAGGGYESRLLKMLQIINAFRESAGDLTQLLRSLERFVDFCFLELPSAELKVVQMAVARFIEQLRRENP